MEKVPRGRQWKKPKLFYVTSVTSPKTIVNVESAKSATGAVTQTSYVLTAAAAKSVVSVGPVTAAIVLIEAILASVTTVQSAIFVVPARRVTIAAVPFPKIAIVAIVISVTTVAFVNSEG